MNQLDVLLLVLFLPFTFRGYFRGLCREIFGLAGSIAGVIAAGAVGPAAAQVLLDEHLAPPAAAHPPGWAVVVVGTAVVAALRGLIAVPRREDALVHGERGARLLPLLRLRRARRRVRLPDEGPGAHLPRGRAPGRRALRRAAARGGGGTGPAPRAPRRGERGGGGVLPGRAARPRRRPGARLPARAWPLRGGDRALRARLGAGRGRGARAPSAHEGPAARGCAHRRPGHAA